MLRCPECSAEIDVDEDEVEEGEILSCPECECELEVSQTHPVALNPISDDAEEEDDEEGEDAEEEDDEFEEDGDVPDDEEDDDDPDEDDEKTSRAKILTAPGILGFPRPHLSQT